MPKHSTLLRAAALLLALACDGDAVRPDEQRDQDSPSLTLNPIDTLSNAPSVTVSGVARDDGQILRMTSRRRPQPCCDGPIDTLTIVPGPEVRFSVTYPLGDGASYLIDVTAHDSAGNSARTTVSVSSDQSAPVLLVVAPVFAPSDSERVLVTGTETRSATVRVAHRVDDGPEQVAGILSGVPSPYPITPRPYFYATTLRPRLGADISKVTLTLTDAAGNAGARDVRIRRAPPIAAVAGGASHWCALASDGVAWCWGANRYGELGTGSTAPTLTPTRAAGGMTFRRIAAGISQTCGLAPDDSLWCWGATVWDVVANMTQPIGWTAAPVRVGDGLRFESVTVGAGHGCALTVGGEAYCWGLNFAGQVGDRTTINRADPTPVAGGLAFSSLTAGAFHTCGLTTDGEAYCWGDNYGGKLGIGATIPTRELAPVRVATSLTFRTLAAGTDQTCGVAADQLAYCWGLTDDNRLGVGIGGHSSVTSPLRVLLDERVASVSVFGSSGCAITLSATTHCWGAKNEGQLGTPFTHPFLGYEVYPILTAYGLPLAQIQTGGPGTCAVSTTGALYCWGSAGSDLFQGRPIVEP